MPTLTANQVAGVIQEVGVPSGTSIAEWITVARKESGFSTDVEDYLGSGHIGLWQISVNHYTKSPIQLTKDQFRENLKVPETNFYMAKVLYQESGWKPWVSSIGSRPVPSATDVAAAKSPDMSATTDAPGIFEGIGNLVGNPLDAITDIPGMIAKFLDPVLAAAKWIGNPANWVRIIQVVGGITLGIVATALVLQPAVAEVKRTIK